MDGSFDPVGENQPEILARPDLTVFSDAEFGLSETPRYMNCNGSMVGIWSTAARRLANFNDRLMRGTAVLRPLGD